MSISGGSLSSLNASLTQAAYLDHDNDLDLAQACERGDFEKAQTAINSGAKCSSDALTKAILSQNPELLSLLLKNDSSLNGFFWKACNDKFHLLNNLIDFDDDSLLDFISRFHTELDEKSENLLTIFKRDNLDLFKVLCEKGDESMNGKNALRLALYFGSPKISAYLFSLRVDLSELEKIRNKFDLSLKTFLPILHLETTQKESEDRKELKSFLRIDFDKSNQQKYQTILNQLCSNKCTIMEMAVYLALKGTKEDLEEIDEFGLRPVDYAILGYAYETVSEDFFHFLHRCKVNLTLGDRTILHLASFLNVHSDFFARILQACEECFSKVKIQKNLINIINLEDHRNIHRQLPWGKKEFINRTDPDGLNAIHHAVNVEYAFDFVEKKALNDEVGVKNRTRIVALLLEAGAISDTGPYRELALGKAHFFPMPLFVKKAQYNSRYWTEKFLQLTPLMLAPKLDWIPDGEKRTIIMIRLLNEEIEPAEILDPDKIKHYFPPAQEVSSSEEIDSEEEVSEMEE